MDAFWVRPVVPDFDSWCHLKNFFEYLSFRFYTGVICLEDHIFIRFDNMRKDYDPVIGTSVVFVSFPAHEFVRINSGGYLSPTNAIYVEPILTFKSFSLAARGGTIVSPQSRQIKKLAIEESFFGAVSLSYTW